MTSFKLNNDSAPLILTDGYLSTSLYYGLPLDPGKSSGDFPSENFLAAAVPLKNSREQQCYTTMN